MKISNSPNNLENNELRLRIYQEFSLETIAETLPEVKDIKDYRRLRQSIEEAVNSLFEDYLKDYSDKFIKNFKKGEIAGFKGTDLEKEKLVKLIQAKNTIFYDIFLAYVERGGLSNLLDGKDLNDLLALLKSGLAKTFDAVFVKWLLGGEKSTDNIPEGLHYAGVTKDGLVPYFNLITMEGKPVFGAMFNHDLKAYLEDIFEYSNFVYSQKEWDKIQIKEVPIWKNSNSKFGFVGPQEAYILQNSKGKLTEPHIGLYLKEDFDEEKKQAKKLFEKYFSDNYGVESLNTYLVEPLIEAGTTGFRKIAGESVPNSEVVAKQTGRINLIIPSRLEKRILDAKDTFFNLVGRQLTGEYLNEVVSESDKFVKFHELGHSLFKDTNYDSDLEELKADLSYFLKLFDEERQNISHNVEAFIGQFIVDVIRVFRSINIETKKAEPARYRYVISKAVELHNALRTGLIQLKNSKITVDESAFSNFLEALVEDLFEIKKIYSARDKQKESEFIKKYDFTKPEIWKIVELANQK